MSKSKLHKKIEISKLKHSSVVEECIKWHDRGYKVTIAPEVKTFIFVWDREDKNGTGS